MLGDVFNVSPFSGPGTPGFVRRGGETWESIFRTPGSSPGVSLDIALNRLVQFEPGF
jgi:hypothetical protein